MRFNKTVLESVTSHLSVVALLNDVAKENPTPAEIGMLLEEIRIHTHTNPKWDGLPATKQELRAAWDYISGGADDEEDFTPTPEPKPSTPKKKAKSQEER